MLPQSIIVILIVVVVVVVFVVVVVDVFAIVVVVLVLVVLSRGVWAPVSAVVRQWMHAGTTLLTRGTSVDLLTLPHLPPR